jgi:hypothetical protein
MLPAPDVAWSEMYFCEAFFIFVKFEHNRLVRLFTLGILVLIPVTREQYKVASLLMSLKSTL